ncbi:hypothetical protein N7491_006375 [Penicillium cf. griseofulvum]|uniref:Uncharacterized protein n=1 Tax=Penicillium cf. griseofulvum TaxID=2972120 RepID=A0A9W9IXJ1_9EURO|nr:hypothetical protein N7472_010597 [Penicillium cf. griseofulvum]KAJ5429359.1 hypothetical protein N7491_006375 [Penicillium cf. griseofulvum]KAJ5436862.1 hypothetical protein N7445_007747 [Penicillium cf. griseofulvum]
MFFSFVASKRLRQLVFRLQSERGQIPTKPQSDPKQIQEVKAQKTRSPLLTALPPLVPPSPDFVLHLDIKDINWNQLKT